MILVHDSTFTFSFRNPDAKRISGIKADFSLSLREMFSLLWQSEICEESGAVYMKTERQNRTVRVFVASSLDDFKNERLELRELFDRMELTLGVRILWLGPETTLRVLRPEGSQSAFNQYIRESDFVFLIVGEHMGKYTLEEALISSQND